MTTISIADFKLSPEIVLGREEHRQLLSLAMAGPGHTAADSDWLLHELERAHVVPDNAVPADIVRIGSTVHFRTEGNNDRAVQVVLPKDADIAKGRISVLTPVGTALIGLRWGQSITWLTRDLRTQVLTVTQVLPPAGEDGDDPGPRAA